MAVAENRSRGVEAEDVRRRAVGVLASAVLAAGVLAAGVIAACGSRADGLTTKKAVPKDDRQAKPWVQVSLESLGFPGVSDTFLQTGASMLTVHLLDDSHLLVTFSTRDLVPRLPGDPKTDDDRMVAAEIVDLPSGKDLAPGKIVARTVWHMHDHGRYLWNLGGGRFLVRIGDRLSIMTPLANLGTADPFERTVFPGQQYRPSVVLVSPDGGLLTVESVVSYVNPDGRAEVLLGDVGADQPVTRTIIQFFRLTSGPASDGGKNADEGKPSLQVVPAGTVNSEEPVALPVDADGYLWAQETGRGIWSAGFDEAGGKTIDLGKIQSSCQPRLQMVSRGEFVAFTCRGTDSSVKIASYGLDGHETWEEAMGDLGTPVFAFAPAAARFALSRTTVAVPGLVTGTSIGEGTPARQEVRVYQIASGDLLLKVECSPIFKSAENFDLSADGLMAAVVRNGAIAVYKLPPPSKQDMEDMAEVAKFAPPPGAGLVSLPRLMEPVELAKDSKGGDSGDGGSGGASAPKVAESAGGEAAAGGATPIAAPDASTQSGGAVAARVEPAMPAARKPPTLLNPGEKPEFGSSNAEQPN